MKKQIKEMAKETEAQIRRLPIVKLIEANQRKLDFEITQTAIETAENLVQLGLQIRRATHSPSNSTGIVRIYLEPAGTKTSKGKEIKTWEFWVQSSGYFHPVSAKQIREFLVELKEEINRLASKPHIA